AMTLNGIGWNFMFVAGSGLGKKAYAPGQRARTPAAQGLLVLGTAGRTSLSSGQLLHHKGWQVVLTTAAVMLLAAFAGSLWRVSRAAGPTGRSGLGAADSRLCARAASEPQERTLHGDDREEDLDQSPRGDRRAPVPRQH